MHPESVTKGREETARRFAREAQRSFPNQVEKVILFGSVARGEDREDSDIDVLVVWRGRHADGTRAMTALAFDLMLETEEYVSVKVLTPEELEEGLTRRNRFVEVVIAEGRALA